MPRSPAESKQEHRRRPVIGVTGPDQGGFPAWFFTWLALRRCGAKPIRITPSRAMFAERLDGFVIGGGADITEPLSLEVPEAPATKVKFVQKILDILVFPFVFLLRLVAGTRRHGIDTARDALELSLLEIARTRDLPVLGICRGAQLMNVAEGGTLLRRVQDFYEERLELYTVLPRREVDIAKASKLASIVGNERLLVNSLHFHAVGDPGKNMKIVAREPAGVTQAVEHATRRFWLGVQWHPEYLPQRQRHQRLFNALVETARSNVNVNAPPPVPRGRRASPQTGQNASLASDGA